MHSLPEPQWNRGLILSGAVALVAPLSGRLFVWRNDDEWMTIDSIERAGLESLASAGDIDGLYWRRWDAEGSDDVSTAFEAAPGDSSTPTWWSAWGECLPDDEIKLRLETGLSIPVIRFAGLWIAEWISDPTEAYLLTNHEESRLWMTHRTAYRPAPPFQVGRPTGISPWTGKPLGRP